MSALRDDEPQFKLVEDVESDGNVETALTADDDDDVHYDGPDEPPVGREFYDEPDH